MLKRIAILTFGALCLMMVTCTKANAQEVVIEDLSFLHEMIDGKKVRAKYIFLESFLAGQKGWDLVEKCNVITEEYFLKKPYTYDPQSILDEFRKYALGRRSWLDVTVLGDGIFAVRNSSGWGVMRTDGSFIIPKGTLKDIGSHNEEQKVFAAWKPGDNKCGIFTFDGKEVCDFKYSHVNASRAGFAIATLSSGDRQVLLKQEGSGDNLFYKEVSSPYYIIQSLDCYDRDDNYHPIFTVRDTNLLYGAIDHNGKLVIPMKYDKVDRNDGAKFGREEYVFIYMRARRSEGGKQYYDYFYAPSLKLVYTEEIK